MSVPPELEDTAAALEWFPDAAVLVGPDRLLRSANTLAARLARVTARDLIGQDVAAVLPLREPNGDDWWRCSAGFDADPLLLPRIPECQLQLRLPFGTPRPVTVTGRRIADANGALATLSVGLRRADRHLDLERRRSDLISTASHELRAPLTSVRGFTKTLLARWDRFDDATRRQMLATIDEDADRVTRLLNALLDISRIDARRLPLQRRIIALADIVAPLARRFQMEHPTRPLTVDVPANLPDVVVDADRIEQVFSNLLDNAVKHGRGAVRITARSGATDICCAVADEGGAIPNARLGQLFAKYYRGPGQQSAGMGLGLYICKGIVMAHGGKIWAHSTPDEGTTFAFTLSSAQAHLTPDR